MNSKDILARLLAGEDITVLRDAVSTASFDIKNRVLRLPVWNDMSPEVEDLLIAHEVSHAKYTFPEYFIRKDLTGLKHTVMNIVEDNRIERLIKRDFPVYKTIFTQAYKELYDKKFFGESSSNILDKINLYSKVGTYSNVEFSSIEEEMFNEVNSTETPEDVLRVTEELYLLVLDQLKDKKNDTGDTLVDSGDSLNNKDNGTIESEKQITPEDIDELDKSLGYNHFDKNLSELSDIESKYNNYNTGNKWNFYGDVIIPYSKIISEVRTTSNTKDIDSYLGTTEKFLEETNNQVMMLVKEFEMRKSAEMYKRTSYSKSGELNMKKIFSYKISDNIFKQNVIVKDGKNHGLMILVDWSQSMVPVIEDVINQLTNLVLFCSKINIPFRVYAFSGKKFDRKPLPLNTKNKILTTLHMLELFSSEMSKSEMKDMIHLLKSGCLLNTPRFNLSTTPLNMALVYINDYMYRLKLQNNIDKMSFIMISDGADTQGISAEDIQESEPTSEGQLNIRSILVDNVTKLDYFLDSSNNHQRNKLLQMIKDRNQCKIIAFYIITNQLFIKDVAEGFELRLRKDSFGKDNVIVTESNTIDKFFFIESEEGMRIKDENKSPDEFSQNKQNSRTSRVLVSKFIEEIA